LLDPKSSPVGLVAGTVNEGASSFAFFAKGRRQAADSAGFSEKTEMVLGNGLEAAAFRNMARMKKAKSALPKR